MRNFNNVIVTGGAGFIGSNFIRFMFEKTDFKGNIINMDKLTYAGNPDNLADIEKRYSGRYFFEKRDICDYKAVYDCIERYKADCIVHFAAESHVDRSIHEPAAFIHTNINGTFNLIEAVRHIWGNDRNTLFHHVSTDEVYGSLGDTGYFYETTPYVPGSLYSSSKAASDHLVNAYYHTYGFNVTMSNCSNNYGPYQFPEKLIPMMLLNMMNGKDLPVYGDGMNIRDWLYVADHCSGIFKIISEGTLGRTYNIGGENEWTNIKLINKMCEIMADETGNAADGYKSLIKYVSDRPGHDKRYAINCDRIKNELGWKQTVAFEEGLRETIKWYLNNMSWVNNIINGEYQKWILTNYSGRLQ